MDFLKSYRIRKTAFLWSLELYENHLLLQGHQKTAYDLNKSQIFHWKAQQFSHNSFHAYLPHAHIQCLCTQLWDTHAHTHTYSQLIQRGANTDACKTHFESIINDSTREANKRELNSKMLLPLFRCVLPNTIFFLSDHSSIWSNMIIL